MTLHVVLARCTHDQPVTNQVQAHAEHIRRFGILRNQFGGRPTRSQEVEDEDTASLAQCGCPDHDTLLVTVEIHVEAEPVVVLVWGGEDM